jgi:hypothetical protein
MPRYQQGKDWVEIAGANTLTMGELAAMDASIAQGIEIVKPLVTEACFVNHKTQAEVVDWRADPLLLRPQQWRWLKGRVWEAAWDEALDPEA